jgi:hypothetical protein
LPARADLGLDATKVWFSETHHWGVIVGCTLFYIAAGILTPSSIAFGIMLAKIEGRPTLSACNPCVTPGSFHSEMLRWTSGNRERLSAGRFAAG